MSSQPAQASASKAPKQPSFTLVHALSPTTYKDEDDKTPKTLAYIKAQQGVLKYLNKTAADQLSPHHACLLTQAIDPETQEPTAAEALRLCYYMRSLGCDVYHGIEEKSKLLVLYVVNQQSHVRGKSFDRPYWLQNYSTNRIMHELVQAPRARPAAPRGARRNALANTELAPAEGGGEGPPDPRTVLELELGQAEAALQTQLNGGAQNPE